MKKRLEEIAADMVDRGILFEEAVAEFEQFFVMAVLRKTDGNLSKTAEVLRIHRNTLSKRVAKYFQNGRMIGARHRRPRIQKEAPTAKASAAKSKG